VVVREKGKAAREEPFAITPSAWRGMFDDPILHMPGSCDVYHLFYSPPIGE